MTSTRRHRGRHPDDERLFAVDARPGLRTAVDQLSWLLSRGYNERSALKLVGDRHALTRRQRAAVGRCSCGRGALQQRGRREVPIDALRGRAVALDGFNCIITLETALSGGVVLRGRDGCWRDLSSVHGTYRWVAQTPRALELIGATLATAGAGSVCWHLDRPVSNSGRLKVLLAEVAERRGWRWTIELSNNPDRVLADGAAVVATSDGWILDHCPVWTNLLAAVIEGCDSTWAVDLGTVV